MSKEKVPKPFIGKHVWQVKISDHDGNLVMSSNFFNCHEAVSAGEFLVRYSTDDVGVSVDHVVLTISGIKYLESVDLLYPYYGETEGEE